MLDTLYTRSVARFDHEHALPAPAIGTHRGYRGILGLG
jgi:hypothetical protein